MHFQNFLEELDAIYEELPAAEAVKNLTEAPEEEIEIVDDEIEIVDDEATEEEPKQVVLECSKCGALVIKVEADVAVDEASDLVNIEDACQYCEETAGYAIVGAIAPYEATTETVEEGLLGKKTEKTIKASEVKKGDKITALDGEKFSRPSKVKEVTKQSDGSIDVFHKDGNFSTDASSTVTILESCDDEIEEGLFGKEVEKTIKASEVKKGDKIVAFDGDKLSKPSKVTKVEVKADIVNIAHKDGTVGGGCDTPVTVLTKE
jgi:hypothetical protein